MKPQGKWYLIKYWKCTNPSCEEYWNEQYKAAANVPYLIKMEWDEDYYKMVS